MFNHRRAFDTTFPVADVTKLRDACMGCKSCKGVCQDLLELAELPKVLLERHGARQ